MRNLQRQYVVGPSPQEIVGDIINNIGMMYYCMGVSEWSSTELDKSLARGCRIMQDIKVCFAILYIHIYVYICYFGRFTNSACWVYLFGSNQPATSATWQKTSAFSCWVCIHRAVYSKLLLLLMILLFILVSRKACFVLVLVLVVVVDINIVVHPGIQESLLCCCC